MTAEADIDAASTGLLVFDMLEGYREAIEESGAIQPCVRLLAACRASGVPVFYARADHRADGSDGASAPTDTDRAFRPWSSERRPSPTPGIASGSSASRVIAELAPQPQDYDIPKHRWNAFFQTPLELSLRARGISTVLVVGGSTHVGVASTVYAGRDMDFDMVVVRDGCTGFAEQRTFFLEHVFPRMCRVRTVAQIEAALVQASGTATSRDG